MNGADDFTLPDAPPAPPREDSRTDIEFERGLPAAIDAERTLLGACFLDPQAYSEIAESLEACDFALQAHQRLFSCIGDLTDSSVAADLVTVSEELRRRKQIESVGGVAWLASLTEGLPRRLSLKDYIAEVKDKSRLRQLISICSNAITRAADQSESTQPILESVEGQLLEIAQESNQARLRTVYDSVKDAGGPDPYMRPITDPVAKPGIPTGYIGLDEMIGGLRESELILVGARPSMGKSSFMLGLAENVCLETGRVAAIFSLEMSRAALEKRLLASLALVDVRRAMSGKYLSGMEREKLHRALAQLVEAQIHIDDSSSLTPTQIRAKARRLKQRLGRLDVILLDYLQLVNPGRKYGNRQEEVAAVTRALKAMAKELNCPVVALTQVARSSEQRQDKRPTLADLRESGSQEADADIVLFIHRDSYYRRAADDGDPDPDTDNIADIICAKQREGPTGTVKLAFIASVTRFGNLDYGR